MRDEFHFSTLPFELQKTTLDWVDMKETLRLLAVCWRLRMHVLNNGAFTRTLRSLDIHLVEDNAYARYDLVRTKKLSISELVDLLYEKPPIRFQVITRHFEGDPWRFDDWKLCHLENVQKLISMLCFCPQIRISGCCLPDGRLSLHYPQLKVEHFVPRNVAHIDKLWLDCRLAHYVGIIEALAESHIDSAIVDTCQTYAIISSQDVNLAQKQLDRPPPAQLPRIERVIVAPRSQYGEELLLHLFDLWRPREITVIILGRRTFRNGTPPPIGDWRLFVHWVRVVLEHDSIQLLLPLADHIASNGLQERLTEIFGEEVLVRHLMDTYQEDHHFAEPRAKRWLRFAPKHPPKPRDAPPRPHRALLRTRIMAKLYQKVVVRLNTCYPLVIARPYH